MRVQKGLPIAFCMFVPILAIASFLSAQSPATQPTASLDPIIHRLASDSFADREAAQKELDKLPPDQFPLLEKLAQSQSNPEIRARLTQQADKMECYIALHPPPINVHVRDATLLQLCDALNRQVGTKTFIAQGNSAATFTLDLQQQSFGEIYRQLQNQHPTAIAPLLHMPNLSLVEAKKPQNFQPFEAFLVSINATSPRKISLPGPAGQIPGSAAPPEKLQVILSVSALPDPRIYLGRYSTSFGVTQVEDEHGKDLTASVVHRNNAETLNAAGHGTFCDASAELLLPESPGTQFTLIRGTIHASVILRCQKFVINDLEKQGDTTVETPLGRIRVLLPAQIPAIQAPAGRRGLGGVGPGPAAVTISAVEPDDPGKAPTAEPSPLRTATLTIVLTSATESTTRIVDLADPHGIPIYGKGPFRLELTVPTKIAEFTLPTEFKLVPLP